MRLSKAAVDLKRWIGDSKERSQSTLARELSVRAATVNAWIVGQNRRGIKHETKPHRSMRQRVQEKTGISVADWDSYADEEEGPPKRNAA